MARVWSEAATIEGHRPRALLLRREKNGRAEIERFALRASSSSVVLEAQILADGANPGSSAFAVFLGIEDEWEDEDEED